MKKIYAFIATALVATSFFFVHKNDSEYLFDANIEALARSEISRKDCFESCYIWFGGSCVLTSSSKGDNPCVDMETIQYGNN